MSIKQIIYATLAALAVLAGYVVWDAYQPENLAVGTWQSDQYTLVIRSNRSFNLEGESSVSGTYVLAIPGLARVKLDNVPDLTDLPRVDYELSAYELTVSSGGRTVDFTRTTKPSWIVRLLSRAK